jgi:hypothetical protein
MRPLDALFPAAGDDSGELAMLGGTQCRPELVRGIAAKPDERHPELFGLRERFESVTAARRQYQSRGHDQLAKEPSTGNGAG